MVPQQGAQDWLVDWRSKSTGSTWGPNTGHQTAETVARVDHLPLANVAPHCKKYFHIIPNFVIFRQTRTRSKYFNLSCTTVYYCSACMTKLLEVFCGLNVVADVSCRFERRVTEFTTKNHATALYTVHTKKRFKIILVVQLVGGSKTVTVRNNLNLEMAKRLTVTYIFNIR
jgi:hypothetical protein